MALFGGQTTRRTFDIVGGFADYILNPARGTKWSPFNGQAGRRQIFDALMGEHFSAIIETGSYLGTTTQCFAETGLPVYSIEGHPRRYGFVKARFLFFRNVFLRLGDTRRQLRVILDELGTETCQRPLFFYLDAHWSKDLPLAEELDIILQSCSQPIIMIDDFQVEGDAGYGFDDYGEGKALIRAYVQPVMQLHSLSLFYPSIPSSQESGYKRGCAILARQSAVDRLANLPEIRLAAIDPVAPFVPV